MRNLIKSIIGGLLYSCAFSASAMALTAAQTPDKFPYIWVQYNNPDRTGGVQKRVVRVVLEDGANCPAISENGASVTMTERALPPSMDNSEFAVTVCSATIAKSSVAHVAITENNPSQNYHLPALPDTANTIVVVGDTGCRVATGWTPQNCDNITPSAPRTGWPLQMILDNIGARNPDAIIHMGDYHYREASPCPPQYQGTCGDTWASWKADWFNPAQSVLREAPWVMLRGNHEMCLRAWRGFNLFLSVEPVGGVAGEPAITTAPNVGCPELTPSYKIALDNEIVLAVVDTASQGQSITQAGVKYCATWAAGIEALLQDAMKNPATHWLTLHHPVYKWSSKYPVKPGQDACPAAVFTGQTYVQGVINANAMKNKPAPNMIFSGHAHMWQWNRPLDANLPLQMVVGNGGTYRDSNSAYALNGAEFIGNTATSAVYPSTKGGLPNGTTGWTNMDIIYGYQTLKKLRVPGATASTVWRIDMYDVDDSLLRVCMSGTDAKAAAVVANSFAQPAAAADILKYGCHVVSQNGG